MAWGARALRLNALNYRRRVEYLFAKGPPPSMVSGAKYGLERGRYHNITPEAPLSAALALEPLILFRFSCQAVIKAPD